MSPHVSAIPPVAEIGPDFVAWLTGQLKLYRLMCEPIDKQPRHQNTDVLKTPATMDQENIL